MLKILNFELYSGVKGKDFIDFEAALLRLGKDYYRKGKVLPFWDIIIRV